MWGDDIDDFEDTSFKSEDVDLDRFFEFMIAKTSEKQEKVVVSQGFTVWCLIFHVVSTQSSINTR